MVGWGGGEGAMVEWVQNVMGTGEKSEGSRCVSLWQFWIGATSGSSAERENGAN